MRSVVALVIAVVALFTLLGPLASTSEAATIVRMTCVSGGVSTDMQAQIRSVTDIRVTVCL